MLISIILLVIFLAAMVAIGIWGMRKTKTLSDFFLGGRTVGPWVSAIAYGTTSHDHAGVSGRALPGRLA